MRMFNRILLILAVLFAAAYYWLLLDNRPGDAAAKPVTIAQLRALAEAMPGQKPAAIEVEQVAYRRLPGNLFAAGTGLKRRLISVMAFRLPVPGGRPILVDSGVTAAAAAEMGMEKFLPSARQRVDAQLRAASLVLLTHEHADHQGGIVGLGDRKLLDKVRFTAGQLPGNRWTDMMTWPQGSAPVASLGSTPRAVAPGVVTIPAPSHTPGSQMIFVHLADGREFLFTGDIATLASSWIETRARSRLVGDYLAPEDRAEVFAWLKTIQALQQAAPALQVIPGHDFEWIDHAKDKRGVKVGFLQ